MDRSAFDRKLGSEQGRVQNPAGFLPPEGDALFVLGSDVPGRVARLLPGDHGEVFQTGDFGAAKLLRCSARLRPPVAPPGGDLQWVAQLRIDDAVVTERVIPATRTRTLSDIGWCVSRLNGDPHKLSFRLQLLGSADPADEIELPAFYVDAIGLDATFDTRPAPLNRSPEPGETNVPIDTTIAIDLVDVGPDGVSAADTQVFINGVLAFDGGVFQTGFTGPASVTSSPQADTYRIEIDPTADFGSEETVVVRVTSRTTGDTSAIDTSYTFTTEDVIAPQVESAAATAEKTIRVVFNEGVSATALEASAYSFARTPGEVAVRLNAVSVAKVSETEVEITTDTEMTPGAHYTVTAAGVEDVAGNVVQAPDNDATFVGYACPKPEGREWDLYEMIPQMNRTEDDSGDLRRFLAVFQEIGDLLLCRIDRFTEIVDPDVADIRFVEGMLDDLGNPFSFVLSDIDKRRLAQVLVAIYKSKGTGPGIVDAIRFFLGLAVTIEIPAPAPLGLGDWELGVDWVLGSDVLADIYTFWIVSPVTLTDEERERITEIADYMKVAHEHFKIVEPEPPPPVLDHVELGLSELGETWILH